jgi:hypothetical protein
MKYLTRRTSGALLPLCCHPVQSAGQCLYALWLPQSELADKTKIRWPSRHCPQLQQPDELDLLGDGLIRNGCPGSQKELGNENVWRNVGISDRFTLPHGPYIVSCPALLCGR